MSFFNKILKRKFLVASTVLIIITIILVFIFGKGILDFSDFMTLVALIIALSAYFDNYLSKESDFNKSKKILLASLKKELQLIYGVISQLPERVEPNEPQLLNPTGAIFMLPNDILKHSFTRGQEFIIKSQLTILELVALNKSISDFNQHVKELHDFRFSDPLILGKAHELWMTKGLKYISENLENLSDDVRPWFKELKLRNDIMIHGITPFAIKKVTPEIINKLSYEIEQLDKLFSYD